MSNKKGFIGGLMAMLIAILITLGIYFLYQKMSAKSLQNTIQKSAQDAGVNVDTNNISPQGQINSVRNMVEKIQDKQNAEIEKELQ